MKKIIAAALAALIAVGLAACGRADTEAGDGAGGASAITVISREEGSGTRGAFVELFGVEVKNDAGEKEDMTTIDADITDSTSVMLTSISGNDSAIGYVSLGALNDTVKALGIDGVEATAANVKSGEYKVSRPFNIVVRDETSSAAEDFIAFILSDEGQAVVEERGYIAVAGSGAFKSNGAGGKVVVAGSSSVTPLMEKLKEAYAAANPGVSVEIQQSDSSTGVSSAADGSCDIGMASRELKDSESSAGVSSMAIAIDGIAVIVNNANPADELTSEQVRAIFTGEITSWGEIAG